MIYKLVKNARYLQTKQNTKEYGYFDYFEVIFGIIDKDIIEYYKGLLNIKVSKKNIPTFYEINQIKKIGASMATCPYPLFIESISNKNKKVK